MKHSLVCSGLIPILLPLCGMAGTYEAPRDNRVSRAAQFSVAPTVVGSDGLAEISFEVSEATDVEVSVLDSAGAIVRHLAAGLLGEHAPPPLHSGSLKQRLTWDFKNDAGEPASDGPFTVRVRLGAQPRFERYVGYNKNSIKDFCVGITVGPEGEVYLLFTNQTYGRTELRVVDREGQYLRTLIPYPAGTPTERLEPFGRLEVRGESIPAIFNAHAHTIVPLMAGMTRQSMCFSPKGHLVMASALGSLTSHGPPRHFLALHPEGGAAENTSFIGPEFLEARGFLGGAGERGVTAYDGMALSPDGHWIYHSISIEHWRTEKTREHAVWRYQWSDQSRGEPFLGQAEAGSGDGQFNDPQGVATDAKGRIYVCDRGNDRVSVFSPKGEFQGHFAVETPQLIAVHPVTGEIYVVSRKPGLSHKLRGTKFHKFGPWRDNDSELLITEELEGKAIEVIAIDPTSSPTKLWVSRNTGWHQNEVLPVEDTGSKFVWGAPLFREEGLNYPLFVHIDPKRATLYVSEWHQGVQQVNLESGEMSQLFQRSQANEAVPSIDSTLYVTRGWKLTMVHTDASGKRLQFGEEGNQIGPWELGKSKDGKRVNYARSKGPHVGDRGHAVAPNGDVYALLTSQYGPGRVDIYSAKGKLKKEGIIKNVPHGSSGIDVDALGNIYLGVNLRPLEGDRLPHGFQGIAPSEPWRYWGGDPRKGPWKYPYFNTYLYHWGSVLKFPPEGGRFHIWGGNKNPTPRPDSLPESVAEYTSGYLSHSIAVEGAKWRYAGCGPIPTVEMGWGDPSCTCNNSRLVADPYGRVFVPNVFRFSVEMVDPAGNQISRIGRYGNVDEKTARG